MRFRRPPLVDPRCVVTGPPLKTAFIMFQRDPHACKQWQNQLEEKKRDFAAEDYSILVTSRCVAGWLITARVYKYYSKLSLKSKLNILFKKN